VGIALATALATGPGGKFWGYGDDLGVDAPAHRAGAGADIESG
jgi:hypothetical protein